MPQSLAAALDNMPSVTSPEEDFAEFRRSGSPAALTAVFDALGAELLLVAAHLAPRGVEAEDLVQATFMAAIEGAQRWDPARPLRPWLVGILVHTARAEGRRLRRQADAQRLPPRGGEPTPLHEVAARELAEQVAHALAALPQPYAQVLSLRLVHGLTAAAIAHTLRCPVGTVKTRLRRGLAMLRRQMPAGLGASALAVLPAGKSLAAVRQAILAKAAAAAPVPAAVVTAATVGGVLLMKKLLLGAAAALVAATLWIAWPGALRTPPPDAAAPPPAAASAPARGTAAQPVTAASNEGSMQPAREAVAVATPVAPLTTAMVRGRCVAAEDGAPLTGCRVELSAQASDLGNRDQAWHPPEPAVTASDGRFELRAVPPPGWLFTLQCAADGRATLGRRWPELAPGAAIEVGDVPLPSGAVVVGRIVDEAGAAVDRAYLTLECDELRGRGPGEFHYHDSSNVLSAADGTLQAQQALLPGRWRVNLESEDALLRPDELLVREGQREVRLDVVVRRAEQLPSISGIVVDEEGNGVGNVGLVAADHPLPFGDETTSAADGSFTVRRRRATADQVYLIVASDRVVAAATPQGHAWGEHDVRIVVRRACGLRLQVVEAGTGLPVEHYAVRCIPLGGTVYGTDKELRAVGGHPGGLATIDSVRPGKSRLIVYPDDPALGPSEPLDLSVDAATAEQRITVARRATLAVHVRRADGAPVAGTRVEVLRQEGPGELAMTTAAAPIPEAHVRLWSLDAIGVVLDAGRTDAEGTVVLRAAPSHTAYVKVLGPGHVAVMKSGVVIETGGSELDVVVEQGAVLRGRVLPAELLAKLGPTAEEQYMAKTMSSAASFLARRTPQLVLSEIGGQRRRLPPQHDAGVVLPADGTFAIDGVPAGDWRVELAYMVHHGHGGSSAREPIGIVHGLRDGDTRELEIDASALMPATIAGRILLDGELYRGGNAAFGATQLHTDSDGRFTVEVRPGEHRLVLRPPEPPASSAAAARAWIIDFATVRADPGARVERTFDVHRHTAKIRVLEADGRPAVERYLRLSGQCGMLELQVDAEGWVVLDPAPPGPIELSTWPEDLAQATARTRAGGDHEQLQAMRVPLGQIEIPSGELAATFEVRVPAGR